MEYLPTKWIKNGHNQGEMKVNILYMDRMGYIIIAFLCWEKCPFQLFKKQNISRQIWRDSVFLTFSRRSKTIWTKTISNGIMPMPQVKSQNKESRLFRSYRYFLQRLSGVYGVLSTIAAFVVPSNLSSTLPRSYRKGWLLPKKQALATLDGNWWYSSFLATVSVFVLCGSD